MRYFYVLDITAISANGMVMVLSTNRKLEVSVIMFKVHSLNDLGFIECV